MPEQFSARRSLFPNLVPSRQISDRIGEAALALLYLGIIERFAMVVRISRNTVRRYLRGEVAREVGGRGPGLRRKLAPYEAWLRRRVESAAPVRLPACR